ETRVVRRVVDLGDGGRSATPNRQSQGVGPSVGQAGSAVVVGQAGRLRNRDSGGIPGRAAPLLRQPFPSGSGQARLGGRQPRQGADAEEGAWPAEDRTSRAPAPERRGIGKSRGRRPQSNRDGDRGGGRRAV